MVVQVMASSDVADHPRNPPSASDEGVEARNLQMKAYRRDSSPAVVIHPELLRAARRGDCERLELVLYREDGAAAATAEQVVVDVSDGKTSANVAASGILASRQQSIEAVADHPAPSSRSLLNGVTFQGDSVLHVVAASGDSPAFIRCANVIYQRAKDLLDRANNKGDTPLHCAARAGHAAMVSRLIVVAKDEEGLGKDERVKEVLTKMNGRRETALHEAVRFGNRTLVDKLMSVCPTLARFPGDGTSPLYLAISLGRERIAELLYTNDMELSYSGPAGQNALHAAVLYGKAPESVKWTQKILSWKGWTKEIAGKKDKSGSTPLHFAASAERREMEEASRFEIARFLFLRRMGKASCFESARFLFLRRTGIPTPTDLLLEAYPSSAYQPDDDGQYPIHVATSMGNYELVVLILRKCPECAGLRDAHGRTFLHVAVENKREKIVHYATTEREFEYILNMQDNDGDTALHLAVQVGILRIFRYLLRNKEVCLNLTNDEGQTPADLSWRNLSVGVYYKTNARMWIHWCLVKVNALTGNGRRDHFQARYIPKLNEIEESKKMTESAQIIGIGSVLVATVAFAAAFTLPGGYIANDQKNGGTPTLAGSYAFDAFMYAIAIAFICSMLATFSLMYSGMSAVDWKIRFDYFNNALSWMWNSTRSLLVSFALGVYLVLAPVAYSTAIGVFLLTAGTLFFRDREVGRILICTYTLQKREGIFIWLRLATQILTIILQSYFVYVVIFVSPVCFQGILKHIPMVNASK